MAVTICRRLRNELVMQMAVVDDSAVILVNTAAFGCVSKKRRRFSKIHGMAFKYPYSSLARYKKYHRTGSFIRVDTSHLYVSKIIILLY